MRPARKSVLRMWLEVEYWWKGKGENAYPVNVRAQTLEIAIPGIAEHLREWTGCTVRILPATEPSSFGARVLWCQTRPLGLHGIIQ